MALEFDCQIKILKPIAKSQFNILKMSKFFPGAPPSHPNLPPDFFFFAQVKNKEPVGGNHILATWVNYLFLRELVKYLEEQIKSLELEKESLSKEVEILEEKFNECNDKADILKIENETLKEFQNPKKKVNMIYNIKTTRSASQKQISLFFSAFFEKENIAILEIKGTYCFKPVA